MHVPVPVERVVEGLRAWGLEDASVTSIPRGETADVFLVEHGGERWVAKLTYDDDRIVEAALRATEHCDDGRGPVSVPVRTTAGDRTVPVEWPAGSRHPLALLRYVPGEVLDERRPDGATLLGQVCGRVHARLLRVDPSELGLDVVDDPVVDLRNGWDMSDEPWLDDLADEMVQRARAVAPALRHAVAVWDGPDIRIDGDTVGLLDFGHTGWHVLVHAVANRSLIAAYEDEHRLAQFLAACSVELPLTAAEHDALHLFRLFNATLYARFKVQQRRQFRADGTPFDGAWLDRLLTYLRQDLPRVGLSVPT
jgi:Ser/Thr protein kinase RdoA (MazF antagonist)